MLPHEIVIELRDLFVLQNTIHWIKSITIQDREGNLQSHGHFKPISSKRFLNDCHEYIFHFTKTGRGADRSHGVPFRQEPIRWRHTVERLRCRRNTWFIPTIQSEPREGAKHPATFGNGGMVYQANGVPRVRRCSIHFSESELGYCAQRCGVKKFMGSKSTRLSRKRSDAFLCRGSSLLPTGRHRRSLQQRSVFRWRIG